MNHISKDQRSDRITKLRENEKQVKYNTYWIIRCCYHFRNNSEFPPQTTAAGKIYFSNEKDVVLWRVGFKKCSHEIRIMFTVYNDKETNQIVVRACVTEKWVKGYRYWDRDYRERMLTFNSVIAKRQIRLTMEWSLWWRNY